MFPEVAATLCVSWPSDLLLKGFLNLPFQNFMFCAFFFFKLTGSLFLNYRHIWGIRENVRLLETPDVLFWTPSQTCCQSYFLLLQRVGKAMPFFVASGQVDQYWKWHFLCVPSHPFLFMYVVPLELLRCLLCQELIQQSSIYNLTGIRRAMNLMHCIPYYKWWTKSLFQMCA